MNHPLHVAIAKEVARCIPKYTTIQADKACGGKKFLPLFSSDRRSRDTQLCKVDLMVLKNNTIKVILEVEESGFNPAKICGKFLTSALASYFIHNSYGGDPVGFSDNVKFVQVIDASKFIKPGSRKKEQYELINNQINQLLAKKFGSISSYELLLVFGPKDKNGIETVGRAVKAFVG